MLDEIKEYRQYTILPNENVKARLKYHSFIKNGMLSGIERAMTIVARGLIFNDNNENAFDEAKTKESLKAWCGFRTIENISAKNWLKLYIKQVFLESAVKHCLTAVVASEVGNDQKAAITSYLNIDALLTSISIFRDELEQKETINKVDKIIPCGKIDVAINSIKDLEKILKKYPKLDASISDDVKKIDHSLKALTKLSEKNKIYSKGIFSDSVFQKDNDNDVKAITYESVIADALELGRLETYYMVFTDKGDPFEKGLVKKQSDSNLLPVLSAEAKNGLKEKYQNSRDLILKITAAYLLQKLYTKQEYVYFNQTDTKNWLVLEKPDIGSGKNGLPSFKYGAENEPLFSLSTISNNISKLKIHPGWIKNFKLVKADDFTVYTHDPDNKGQVYYIDQGSRAYLIKRVIE